MTESDYVAELITRWPSEDHPQMIGDLLELVDRALAEHPRSPQLLCIKGDLLQLAPEDYVDQRGETVLVLYQKALEFAPQSAEAWESLGYYYDVYEDDYPAAINAFSRALACGAGVASVYGLARSWAEKGDAAQAFQVLDDSAAKYEEEERAMLQQLRDEISAGEWSPEADS